jgi:valyl-tRNA synthetase
LEYTEEKLGNAYSFIVKNVEFFIPFGDNVDIEGEKVKITEELEYTKGFLNSVRKKLGNTNFVSNAPEDVVASEKKKQADAEEKIKLLEEKLLSLN